MRERGEREIEGKREIERERMTSKEKGRYNAPKKKDDKKTRKNRCTRSHDPIENNVGREIVRRIEEAKGLVEPEGYATCNDQEGRLNREKCRKGEKEIGSRERLRRK